MVLEPIDFQGRFIFDEALSRKLKLYLDEKEAQLSNKLVHALYPSVGDPLIPVLPPPMAENLKLAEALELIGQIIRDKSHAAFLKMPVDDWKRISAQWQNALWEYTETIQGCTTELFQQLKQIGFEHWHRELSAILDALKEVLLQKVEGLSSSIQRLEELIGEYRKKSEKQTRSKWAWVKKKFCRQSILDKELLVSLSKTEKELKSQSQKFINKHAEYLKLNVKIDESLRKFKGYQALAKLEFQDQGIYKSVYRMLKVWEKNQRLKSLPEAEPVLALKNIIHPDKAVSLFKEYYEVLLASLYERSRLIKEMGPEKSRDLLDRALVQEVLKGYRAEIHTLGVVVAKYREFLLRTDPDPYVRSRWGFAEWIVGLEPANAKQLQALSYEIENLDQLFEKLHLSIQDGPLYLEDFNTAKLSQDIEKVIHEMGQPLTSRQLMHFQGEQLLKLLEQLDELGSFNPSVVDIVGKYLSQALRADWQYHVLHEFPLYRSIYAIHHGIVERHEDRTHRQRLGIFKKIIDHLERRIKNRETQKHSLEIDLDINDMKGYLQDFFASVQRLEGENLPSEHLKLKIKEIELQLLEYRDLFGSFFNRLSQNEGKLLRNSFLFVDQYFEAIESRLQDLKNRPSG